MAALVQDFLTHEQPKDKDMRGQKAEGKSEPEEVKAR